MSRDYDPEIDGPLLPPPTPPELPKTKAYPICPECGCNTVVMFSPPKDGLVGTEEGYRLWAESSPDYVDWNRAHLYCCNGETNCNWTANIRGGLTTPVKEARYKFGER